MRTEFAPEFDPAFYREIHQDLRHFSDAELFEHYQNYGRAEGRAASPMALRPSFLEAIRHIRPALEIGPFDNPLLKGPGVKYFDVLDTDALKKRAEKIGSNPENVPFIDYVSDVGDLGIVSETFNLVLSSHVIEHQPDLIRHLNQVAAILKPAGCYAVFVPDHRYCFDHFLSASNIAEVIDAHFAERRVHTLASLIEHSALTTHNDAGRHWRGDHGDSAIDPNRVRGAIQEWTAAAGRYIDVHAWQFTPTSFRSIIGALHALGLSRLYPLRVYETVYGSVEFCAILAPA